jgi:hypothetical protein
MDSGGGSVWHFNSTTGIFTNYTAAVKTGGAGNLPIHGEVGDMIYFTDTTSTFQGGYELVFDVPAGQTANDYEYAFEYWDTLGAWRTWGNYLNTRVVDRTNNFTQNSHIFLLNLTNNNNVTTINGITSSWKRIRITKKGTGTPVISRMRRYTSATYCNDWNYKQWYTVNFKILDEQGNPISGVSLVVKNKDGATVLTKISDVNGDTPPDYINTVHSYFDDNADLSLSPTYWGRGKEVDYSPFTVFLSKVGYETYMTKVDITGKLSQTVTLKKIKKYLVDDR